VSAQAVPAPPRPASAQADGRAAPARRPGGMTLLLLGCLLVGAASLLTVSSPTYDPWAWIIWGREIAHLDLVTIQGPSWKPLPVLFTTPFSLFGDDAAPALWLVIARASGVLAFAMAYRLGERLAGLWAGAIAALALVFCDDFIRDFARGNSEGMLVAIVLWAIERHLDGRRTQAFLLGFAASLLRPELWPLWGLYGLWLIYQAWDAGPPRREIAVVAGCALLCVLVWFVPEYLGSGDWLRAAERAREPNPGSAAFASSPFVEVFRRSAALLTVPVYVGAVLATAMALWRRDHVRLALAAMATVLMVAVAAMTQFGFAGNLRYVALPAALVCVLAGAGWVDLVRLARDRRGVVAAALLAAVIAAAWVPFVSDDVNELRADRELTAWESDFYGPNLKAVIAKAGGAERVKSCGTVYAGPFQVPSVAWRLHLHVNQVGIFPFGPGTTMAMGATHLSVDPRYPQLTKTRHWIVGSSCGRG
jgi:hypothetical protein